MVVGARKIRSEKLREHQYREGYARFLDGNGVEWYRDNEWWWRKVRNEDFDKYYERQYGERLKI